MNDISATITEFMKNKTWHMMSSDDHLMLRLQNIDLLHTLRNVIMIVDRELYEQ